MVSLKKYTNINYNRTTGYHAICGTYKLKTLITTFYLSLNMSIRTSFPVICWPELYNGRGRGWSGGFANTGGIRDIVGRRCKVPNHDVSVIRARNNHVITQL